MDKDKSTYHSEELQETARKLTERIREADKVEESEIEISFQAVMEQVKKQKSRSRLHLVYWWIASAAAVVSILWVMNWWNDAMETAPALDIALLNDSSDVNTNEVTLIAGNQSLNLKNDASLNYDTTGHVNIQQEALQKQKAQAPVERNEMHRIVVPEGKRANILFSDGTKIYINSGSKVIYPGVFDKDKREILVEGEVYLDVVKNSKRPFIVKTKGFDIRVLGTSFNVSAYGKDNPGSVVLVQGSVVVTTENKHEVQLKPNQMVDIHGNKTSVQQVDVSEYISWKDNMLQVNQKRLSDIFKKLELYYGYKIHYDTEIASMSLTGKLDLLPSIEEVMDNLCLSFPLQYNINQSKEIQVSLK